MNDLVFELDQAAARGLACAPELIPRCLESIAAREIEKLTSQRDDLLQAIRVALCQLETLGGKRRRFPNDGQDRLHAEILELIDSAIAKVTGVTT